MPKSLRSMRHLRLIAEISELRRSRGMTQAQLAAAIGRPQSFIAKVEGGERRLEVIEFAELVEALGHEPDAVLGRIIRR